MRILILLYALLAVPNLQLEAQQVEHPGYNPSHYEITLDSEFVDSLYIDVQEQLLIYLGKNLNSNLTDDDFCFQNELSDSVYYRLGSNINARVPMEVAHAAVPDSMIDNPYWWDRPADYDNLYKVYRYSYYYILNQPSRISSIGNEGDNQDCLATITFSKLYEHEDFLLGEIFVEWKKVNMDIWKFRLLCFELRDWKRKGELRIGNSDEIEIWDWEK